MSSKNRKRQRSNAQSSASSTKMRKVASHASSSLFSLLKEPEWQQALKEECSKDYWKKIEQHLATTSDQIFPPKDVIFNAFNRTPLSKVKVVLLGQDPYHGKGEAMGLAFSVPHDVKVPPSLKNIYKELETDIPGFLDPGHGNLKKWTNEGVLLLNTVLTVVADKPGSHSSLGWHTFTDEVIKVLSSQHDGIVFMLWGNYAHKKEKLIDSTKHTIIKNAHPSPLSFGKFKGCKCFSQANEALKKKGKTEIDWKLK